jgi:ubiquinone/menaquinone biosynthesis C-methylase UbiE
MRAFLRVFFHFLYHPFAFAYDLVAAVVSFGHWKDWILEVVPFIKGTRTLEIGHGPGHLHRFLLRRSLTAVAMDESASMSRLARRRLSSASGKSVSPHSTPHFAYAQINLTRGLAQELPFRDGAFETVIATFPAEYISDPRTLTEVKRCLSDGGRFVVLPVALPKNGFLSWLFQVTGQTPTDALQVIQEKLKEPFIASAFDVETHVLERTSGTLIVIVAKKIPR